MAFKLHDTSASRSRSPQEIAAERGIDVDIAASTRRWPSSAAGRKDAAQGRPDVDASADAYRELLDAVRPHRVHRHARSRDQGPRARGAADRRRRDVEIFLDRTPFYAESGGQVGDTGTIRTDTGAAEVLDTTYALPGLRRHRPRRRRRDRARPGGHGGASTSSAATRSAATTPAPTSCTGRCARCSASTSSSRARSSRPTGCGSTSATTRRSPPRRSPRDRGPRQPRGPRQRPGAPLRDHQGRGRSARRHRLLRRQVRRHRARARGRPALASSCAAAPTCRPSATSARSRSCREGSIGSNLRRIEAITGTGPIERLRHDEARAGRGGELLGVKPDELVDGVEPPARRDEGARATRSRRSASRPPDRTRPSSPRRPSTASSSPGRRRDPRRAARPRGRRPRAAGHPRRGRSAELPRAAARRSSRRSRTDSGLNAGDAHRGRGQDGAGRRRARAPTLAVAGGKDPSRPRRGPRAGAGGGRAFVRVLAARPRVEAHRGGGVRPDRADREPRPGHPTHGLEGR